MAASVFPCFQFFDNSGNPLAGGKIYTYDAGSTTPKNSYQDEALSVAHANPVELDAYGRPPAPIWCDGETKVVIKTAADVQLNPVIDNFNQDSSSSSGWGTKGEGALLKSATYDLTTADDGKTVVATSGTWTLGTDSVAATMGDGYVVDFINVGTGVVTFNPNGAETVDGETSIAFGQGDGGRLICDGANWRVMRTRNYQRPSMRNRLINGDMRIDQRNAGVAQSVTSGNVYCVDRWAVSGSGGISNCSVQRVATGAPGGARYALRMLRSSGTYSGAIQIAQAIETANCYDLAGKTVTLSFRARKGAGYTGSLSAISGIIRSGTAADEGVSGGTAGTWTGYAQDGSTTVTLTTDWQTFSVSAQIQANAQEVMVMIATANFSGSGGATDYVEVTDVQLEIGGVPTDFDRRQHGIELALCQRYYCKSYDLGTALGSTASAGAVVGISNGGGFSYISIDTPQFMRIAPTVTLYNQTTGGTGTWRDGGGADRAVAANGRGEKGFYVQCTTAAANSTITGHWIAGAEL